MTAEYIEAGPQARLAHAVTGAIARWKREADPHNSFRPLDPILRGMIVADVLSAAADLMRAEVHIACESDGLPGGCGGAHPSEPLSDRDIDGFGDSDGHTVWVSARTPDADVETWLDAEHLLRTLAEGVAR